jgi:hypothetical protein
MFFLNTKNQLPYNISLKNTVTAYLCGICKYNKKSPPSYGLPCGPVIEACQWQQCLSNGVALIPSGGSDFNVFNSLRNLP